MNITLCEMVNTKQVGWRKKTKLNTKKQLKPVEKVKTSSVFIFPEPKQAAIFEEEFVQSNNPIYCIYSDDVSLYGIVEASKIAYCTVVTEIRQGATI